MYPDLNQMISLYLKIRDYSMRLILLDILFCGYIIWQHGQISISCKITCRSLFSSCWGQSYTLSLSLSLYIYIYIYIYILLFSFALDFYVRVFCDFLFRLFNRYSTLVILFAMMDFDIIIIIIIIIYLFIYLFRKSFSITCQLEL